jgi:hypothetical protein
MAKSNKVLPKKGRGRPATGRDPVTAIRLSAELRATVDKWAAKQDDMPGRSEAIRRLVEMGLARSKKFVISRSDRRVARAKQLAAEAIDRLVDPATPIDEVANRKRRLLKGPEELHNSRVDHEQKD